MSGTEPHRAVATEDEVATLFDLESSGYDDAHEGPRGHLLRARVDAVLEALGPGPGEVLDAGMGPGRLLAELAARGWTVSGIDVSERMVALAAARLPEARERLVQGTLTALPFGDCAFDAVVSTGVVEYLEEPGHGIAELVRVLRPGGSIAVTMPNTASLHSRWTRGAWYPAVRTVKRAVPGFRRPAPYEKPGVLDAAGLVAALRAAGAEPARVSYVAVTLLPAPLDLLAPTLGRRRTRRLEGGGGRASRALALQVLVVARKAGDGRLSPGTG